jgi:hypothetical protein
VISDKKILCASISFFKKEAAAEFFLNNSIITSALTSTISFDVCGTYIFYGYMLAFRKLSVPTIASQENKASR